MKPNRAALLLRGRACRHRNLPARASSAPAEEWSVVLERNKYRNRPRCRLLHPLSSDDAERGRSVSAHAVNYLVREVRRQHVGLKQLGVRPMRPLLRAGFLLFQRLAKSEGSTGK